MILYFTGTGNSRYVAQRIAERMGDEAHCINDKIREKDTRSMKGDGSLIVVAPTYAWRLPRIVAEWLIKTLFPDTKEAWFVMNCGDGIGAAGRYNRQLCAEKGWIYKGTAQIVMPENYLAMFGTPEKDEAAHIVAAANPVIDRTAARIAAGEGLEEKPSTLLDRMLSGAVNDAFYPLFVKDKAFITGEKCTGCGACVRLCPRKNITLSGGRPRWGGNCTHCMACISYCPTQAIEYGKKSAGKPRYHIEVVK